MAEKRKDHRGRVLKTGESQRKDLIYQYRYTDVWGIRRTVYSSDLKELREKEAKIQSDRYNGVDYSGGGITVLELYNRYVSTKRGVRYSTKRDYDIYRSILKKEDFAYKVIRDVRMSDAKLWLIKLHEEYGYKYGTISNVKANVGAAFKMALDECCIARNPFDFKLSSVVENDSESRVALTGEQQKIFLDFIRHDTCCSKHYDEIVVLLGTGLRISEFCGLTFDDLDFDSRKIRVDHQLLKTDKGAYHVTETKSKSGIRFIPMTDDVYHALKNIIANRPKIQDEFSADGYSGFILLNNRNRPKVSRSFLEVTKRFNKKYERLHPDDPMPKITPHIFRHTFCTNMANAGMDAKSLQYIMGHSDVSVTLGIYTHASYERAAEQMMLAASSSTTPSTTPFSV